MRSHALGMLFGLTVLTVASSSFSPANAGVSWATCGEGLRIHGEGVQCSSGVSYPFTANGPGEIWVAKLSVPSTHCAPVRYRVEIDGRYSWMTRVLSAGQSELVTLGRAFSRGNHTVTIKVQVNFGGCYPEAPAINPQSWGVDTQIMIQPE